MTEEQRYTEIMLAFEKLHKRIDELEEKFKQQSFDLDYNQVKSFLFNSPLPSEQLIDCINFDKNFTSPYVKEKITVTPYYKTEGEVEHKYEPIVKTEYL